jgi:hypothetical protein
MFHTVGYKGHYIHLAYQNGIETIQTQIMNSDGRFQLQLRKTYAGAQRAITKHMRASGSASGK